MDVSETSPRPRTAPRPVRAAQKSASGGEPGGHGPGVEVIASTASKVSGPVVAPVFATGADGTRRMVLIASIQCHHGDTGGGVPGGYNITAGDIWGEGVRWPVVKVIDRGVERRDVLYALQANNRIPSYIGDLRAQIGAAQLATQRLGDMIERYGANAVEDHHLGRQSGHGIPTISWASFDRAWSSRSSHARSRASPSRSRSCEMVFGAPNTISARANGFAMRNRSHERRRQHRG